MRQHATRLCACDGFTGGLLLDDADGENPVAAADVVDDVEPLDHPAEAGVDAVEVLRIFAIEADEELRAARIAAGVGHREHAPVVVLERGRGLALDAVARAARSVAAGASALDDEVGDDAVEGQPVVEVVVGQVDEVGHRAGCRLGVEFGLHHPFLGRNDCVLFHVCRVYWCGTCVPAVFSFRGRDGCRYPALPYLNRGSAP